MAKRKRKSARAADRTRQGALFPEPGFFRSIAEVAEYLDISSGTIRRWIRGGELVAHRVGHQFRIHSADLEAFLAERRG